MESVKRLFDILPFHQSHYLPKEDVLAGKEEGKWKKYSIDQYTTHQLVAIANMY